MKYKRVILTILVAPTMLCAAFLTPEEEIALERRLHRNLAPIVEEEYAMERNSRTVNPTASRLAQIEEEERKAWDEATGTLTEFMGVKFGSPCDEVASGYSLYGAEFKPVEQFKGFENYVLLGTESPSTIRFADESLDCRRGRSGRVCGVTAFVVRIGSHEEARKLRDRATDAIEAKFGQKMRFRWGVKEAKQVQTFLHKKCRYYGMFFQEFARCYKHEYEGDKEQGVSLMYLKNGMIIVYCACEYVYMCACEFNCLKERGLKYDALYKAEVEEKRRQSEAEKKKVLDADVRAL